MAKRVLLDVKTLINGVDFSDHLAAVTWSISSDEIETTAFGTGWRSRTAGLKDATVTLSFHQDFATTGSGAVALVAADTIQTASSTAISNVTTTIITPKIYGAITTATYTPLTGATAPDTVNSFLEIVGAYVDTVFGDCSFSPIDHVEYQPIEIYASITALDPLGNQCLAQCFVPTETQQAIQGRGFGETLIRELILAKRYQQEPWQQDPRLREVLDYNPFGEVTRASKYFIYNLLHSVPRRSNPSGTMDNDQYMIRIFVPLATGRLTALEQGITEWLETANNYDTKFTLLP
jgi:hypothetical protein